MLMRDKMTLTEGLFASLGYISSALCWYGLVQPEWHMASRADMRA